MNQDQIFLQDALEDARKSRDPRTQVGSVLVIEHAGIWIRGCNAFPSRIAETPERLNDRAEKLKLIIHAELNVLIGAARLGVSTMDSVLYTVCTDSSGDIWGGPPCTRCAVHLIAAGVREIVSPPFKKGPSSWRDDLEQSRLLLAEAGVLYREVPI